jgi:hypothetical protein
MLQIGGLSKIFANTTVDVAVGGMILQATADSMADLPSDEAITLTFRIEDTIAIPPAP